MLGIRLVYARRETGRRVSFEFLNRQLVWHAFTVSFAVALRDVLHKPPAYNAGPLAQGIFLLSNSAHKHPSGSPHSFPAPRLADVGAPEGRLFGETPGAGVRNMLRSGRRRCGRRRDALRIRAACGRPHAKPRPALRTRILLLLPRVGEDGGTEMAVPQVRRDR
ncbi:MAG: hypothetical protein BJ554DRAFT_7923 [Olpidium bornovanus]|uniref:Uncharacterized protein n=1 Tax=Olpidium bornovanus TaxID=278681 RepID=A0A8H8DJG4_9FUNG|nr:MAG: hypothetical protein BJ554DRAFT_7923 [Olpidium bornovanus]